MFNSHFEMEMFKKIQEDLRRLYNLIYQYATVFNTQYMLHLIYIPLRDDPNCNQSSLADTRVSAICGGVIPSSLQQVAVGHYPFACG